jgi:hypothetical protein
MVVACCQFDPWQGFVVLPTVHASRLPSNCHIWPKPCLEQMGAGDTVSRQQLMYVDSTLWHKADLGSSSSSCYPKLIKADSGCVDSCLD